MSKKKIGQIIGIVVIVAAIVVVAIKVNQENESGKITLKNNKISSEPKGPMPIMLEASKFLTEIDKDKYPEAASPKKPKPFRWDFSGGSIYAYDFYQKMETVEKMISSENNIQQKMEGTGTLLMKSQGNRTGAMVLQNLKVKIDTSGSGDGESKQTTSEMPPVVIEGIEEDGSIKQGNMQQNVLIDSLFPLPTKALDVGESAEAEKEMPFQVMGSLINVKVKTTIILTKYVMIDDHICARLETATDISQLNIPGELKGTYKIMLKGKSIFYFDTANNSFVSGGIALVISTRIEAPMPKKAPPGENRPKTEMPEMSRMFMDIDNLIKVKRNPAKIKEAVSTGGSP